MPGHFRGEIATRILQCARELSLETFALVTPNDNTHAIGASHVLSLPSPAHYLDTPTLIEIAKQHSIDAVHPGYGFLSESAEFARLMWQKAGVMVICPGWEILERTGDKLAAKLLARDCDVPTLPATGSPVSSIDGVRSFTDQIGFPIMLKAVDGGGGKGIRLVRREGELEHAAKRALAESPSHQIFLEKAAVDGFRHVEVQIIGDGEGDVRHLWERECSIQRRYQKIVEMAPSTIGDRRFVATIIEAAIRMARAVNYLSLGTFEFLANPATQEYFFLEVNPRLQVEHTITESISLVDIVKIQFEIAQGASLSETALQDVMQDSLHRPRLQSIQLRLTAENVQSNWSISIGRINSFSLPAGNGIRTDTHLIQGHPAVVGADFDSLLAKIIVTGTSWKETVAKCRRALADTQIDGVKTNLDILRAVVAHPDFESGTCDTTWLESNISSLLSAGVELSNMATQMRHSLTSSTANDSTTSPSLSGSSSSAVVLRKGDAWAIKLGSALKPAEQETHHLKLTRILRNEFPSLLRAELEYSQPGSQQPMCLAVEATSSSASSGSIMAEGKHRRGNANDPKHILIPFPGKLVELLVDEGDVIEAGQVVCVIQQMKMELEVRASQRGRVKWITEAQDGEDVAEGTLAAELENLTQDGRNHMSKL
ncbi:biotin carboxylase [Xylariaceae sp. FL0016]|nr:biotin carboxylase [Xylariaceae sp. FL0016]